MTQYLKDRYGLLINGEWVDAENGATFETHNPATGELLALCANASAKDVDRAVKAAAEAQPPGRPSRRPNVPTSSSRLPTALMNAHLSSPRLKRSTTASPSVKPRWSTYRFRRIISATSPAASAPMKAKQR